MRACLSALSTNKATGMDLISGRFLRDSANTTARVITHLVNLSINQGKFPSEFKRARVVPLHKKHSKTDAGNYRPVSILTTMSKVFERLVFEQVEDYLSSKKLIYEHQSGFRSAHSTETCLIDLFDCVKKNFSDGNLVGMVLLDLQKAFDTVNHFILLAKLKCLGFNETTVKWFSSYLTQRSQVCDVDGARSEPLEIECGVPQGSILGPLLFLIYVNDMPAAVKCKLLLYADDSALLVPGKKREEIELALSKELEGACEWLIDNKLSIHLGKTECILFGTRKRLAKAGQLNVVYGNTKIAEKDSVKYLGVELDRHLSANQIASKLISRSTGKLKFLYRNTQAFDFSIKKMLISSLFQCHFDYACSAWYSGLTGKLKTKLQVTQNRAIRYILNLPHRAHVGGQISVRSACYLFI